MINKYPETVLISTLNGRQRTVPAIWKGDRFSVTQSTTSECFVITHNKTGMSLDPGFGGIDHSIELMIKFAEKMNSSEILREFDDQVPVLKDKYELFTFQENNSKKIDRWLIEVRKIYLEIIDISRD